MNRPSSLAFLFILLAGCGKCELEMGTYDVTAIETSGDCGPLTSTTLVIVAGELPYIGGNATLCSGPSTLSGDGCTINFDRVCDSPAGTVQVDGFTEIVSPMSASGSFRMRAAGIPCISTYDVYYQLR